MTSKAISTLAKDRDGSFLLVEEEGIDEMAQSRTPARSSRRARNLDSVVSVATRYAKTHRDTLVIVLADQETGSLAIEDVPRCRTTSTTPTRASRPARPRTGRSTFQARTRSSSSTGPLPTPPPRMCR